MHETLLENISTNISKSERRIANKTLSQNNSTDVSENNIMELKDKEHKEPPVTEKVKGYFNIFECGINILDRLDVTYQQEFMATPSENDHYKEMLKNIIKVKKEGGKLCNEKLRRSVIDLRAETNVEHKRNINDTTCDDLYQSPMKKNMY